MRKTIPWLLSLSLLSWFFMAQEVQARCSRAENYYHFLVGEYLLQKGALEEGLKSFEKLIKCDPQALLPRRELMRLYAEKGQYDKAVAIAKEILKESPQDEETLFLLAKVYLAQGRTARAVETLENILEKDPSNEQALSVLANIYLRERNITQAIETLRRISEKAPDNPLLWLQLARLYREKGNFKQTKKAYTKAYELEPDSTEIILEFGEFLEKIGAFKEAESLYRRGIRENPQSYHLYEALLRLYLRQERFEKALKVLDEMEQKLGVDSRLLLRKALILLDLKRTKEAEELLRKLLKNEPENYNAWFYLGLALEREKRLQEAIHAYENIPPGSLVFELAVRRLAVLQKDPSQIEALLRRALEKNPDDRSIYLLAGTVFEELDACPQGYALVQEGLEKFPEDKDLAVAAGLLLICMGREEEALKLVEKFLKKNPNDPTLLNFVGYTLADLNRELDLAEKYIVKALKLRPDSGYILDSMAWVYYRRGQFQKALDYINRAVELTPDDPIIQEHLGDILLALGKKEEALKAYRKALALSRKKREKKRLEKKIQELCGKLSSSS